MELPNDYIDFTSGKVVIDGKNVNPLEFWSTFFGKPSINRDLIPQIAPSLPIQKQPNS